MSLWDYANPVRFMALSARLLPWCAGAAALLLAAGLGWGFFLTPDDFRQGASVKIIFLHVPAAMMATGTWFMMLLASLVWLIRRHHVSALAARAAAPVGLTFTLVGLATGALWGQPIWGSWWEWDPRLTAFLILALFYLGYIALWQAVEAPETAADLTGILCLVGTVFAFLSRYAVLVFGDQGLHQGSSLSLDREENMADVFSNPLYVSIAGFFMLFVTLVLLRTRTEVRARRLLALSMRERMA